jgi:hypothetical protein
MDAMRRAYLAIAVALTIGVASLAAQERLFTGKALRASCQQYLGGEFIGTACEHLVKEVADVSRVVGEVGVCLPPWTPRELRRQVRAVVVYLDDHPDELVDEDVTLVVRALQAAFPCQ